MKAVADLTFAEASAELDGIIGELDRGVADVDQLAERFSRATDIAEELARRLDATSRQIEEIAPRLARLQGVDSESGSEA